MEPEWAFGAIHYELAKCLSIYGYDCRLLPWNKSYTREEMAELDSVTDLYLTNPHGWRFLGYNYGTTVAEKCAIVCHSRLDLVEFLHHQGSEDFKKFYSYSCVSEWLRSISRNLGVPREPALTPLGINCNSFFSEPSEKLTTLGYAGTYHDRPADSSIQDFSTIKDPSQLFLLTITNLKRGYLIKEIAQNLGLNFRIAQHYHHSFVTMPGFYRNIDCLIAPSTEEGAGLPVLEAGAAGRLVIGTEVGHWPEKIKEYGGIKAPIPENEFVEKTIEILNYYISNPKIYREKCYQIREHAKTYDWKHVVEPWLDLLK